MNYMLACPVATPTSPFPRVRNSIAKYLSPVTVWQKIITKFHFRKEECIRYSLEFSSWDICFWKRGILEEYVIPHFTGHLFGPERKIQQDCKTIKQSALDGKWRKTMALCPPNSYFRFFGWLSRNSLLNHFSLVHNFHYSPRGLKRNWNRNKWLLSSCF